MTIPSTPILTERLLLRPYVATDAPAFFTMLDESRSRLLASFPDRLQAVATLTDAQRQLTAFASDWRTGRFYVFGIWQRITSRYLGDICLMPQRDGQAEIGYYLAAAAEGQGYAREALGAVVAFGFGVVQARRLLIRCFADNERGQAVARALGFAPEVLLAVPTAVPWLRLNFWEKPPQPPILHFVRTPQLSAQPPL